jgi:hypothetical protein
MARPRRVVVALIVPLLFAAFVGGVPGASAADPTPTIATAVDSGPPGLTLGISGAQFQAGTTYGLCLLPPDKVQCGYFGSDLGSFTADAGGSVPAGTRIRVPGVLAGSYHLVATAPGTAAIVAATVFSVTAPTLSLDPPAGPGGLVVAVTGSGYGPAAVYSLCIVPSGAVQCGGAGILLGDVTADGSGNLPAGTTVTIPGQLADSYDIGVMLKGAALPNLITTEPFVEVGPTIALGPATGPGGTTAILTGAGLAPGGRYTVCIVPPAATRCGGAGTNLASFTADSSGAIPAGMTVTIPVGDPGAYPVGILLNDSTPFLLGSVTFARTAGTAPPATPPGEPTAAPGATPAAAGSGGLASPAPSAAPAASDQGSGGTILWILVVLAIIAVIVVGLVVSRRRGPAID